MVPFSELSMQDATALLTTQLRLGRAKLAMEKTAAITEPKDLAQALQFMWTPPRLGSTPEGTPSMTDPFWGTVNKALLGAGAGLGVGVLGTALNGNKKKRWLRNALLGTLLGAGAGGGMGAAGHYGSHYYRTQNQSTAAIDRFNRAVTARDQYISSGQPVPDAVEQEYVAAAKARPVSVTGQQTRPLGNSLRTVVNTARHEGAIAAIPQAHNSLVPTIGHTLIGATGGNILGRLFRNAVHAYHDKATEGRRMQQLPDATFGAATAQTIIPPASGVAAAIKSTPPAPARWWPWGRNANRPGRVLPGTGVTGPQLNYLRNQLSPRDRSALSRIFGGKAGVFGSLGGVAGMRLYEDFTRPPVLPNLGPAPSQP